MSRVDQRQQEAAREAERAQKKIDQQDRDNKTSNENREKFASMMKKGNEARQNAQAQGKKGNEARARAQQAAQGKGNLARMAAMARGGGQASQRLMAQVKSFEGAMARAKGFRRVFVPRDDAPEAALMPEVEVIPVGDLSELYGHLTGLQPIQPMTVDLRGAFEAAQALGQLDARADPALLAGMVQMEIMGLRVYAQRSVSPVSVEALAEAIAARVEALRVGG